MAIDIPVHIPIIDLENRSTCKELFEGYWYWGDKRITVVSKKDNVSYYQWAKEKNNWKDTLVKVLLLVTLLGPIIGTIFLLVNYHERKTHQYKEWQYDKPTVNRASKIFQRLTETIPLDFPKKTIINHYISHPILHEISSKIASCEYSTASTRGCRKSMEDTHFGKEIVLLNGQTIPLFAVMDGHGGKECSLFLKSYFPDLFAQEMNNFDWANSDIEVKYDFLKSLSKLLENGVETYVTDSSGSTMVCAFIIDNTLWVMNTGDSRAVLSKNGHAVQLSEDANFQNPRFLKSIFKNGGVLHKNKRLNGVLGVARAYGDIHGKNQIPGLVAHPKIKTFDLNSVDKHKLILACDGLWDTVGSQEAVNFVHYLNLDAAAAFIVDLALRKGSTDNITAMVIQIN